MNRIFHRGAWVAFACFFVAAVACSTGPTGTAPAPAPAASGTGTTRPTDPAPDASSGASPGRPVVESDAPACSSPDACPYWYCDCETGPPVNTRHCTNGRCEDARQACPSSCKSFKTCWTGKASGGWDGGSNAGPDECHPPVPPEAGASCGDATSFTDIGKSCAGNMQCQSGQCWGINPSFVCTKRCSSASACPLHWKCEKSADGFDICMQGSLAASPVSTNAACGQVTFTDLGGACVGPTNCQSSICLGSSYCSRRCEVAADCPAGWSCTTGASFNFCTK